MKAKNYKVNSTICRLLRVSVQEVKSLGGDFACLCRGFDFYEVKNHLFFVIIFQKEKGNTFTLLSDLTPWTLTLRLLHSYRQKKKSMKLFSSFSASLYGIKGCICQEFNYRET